LVWLFNNFKVGFPVASSILPVGRSDAAGNFDELLGRFEDVEISVVVGNLEEFVRPDTIGHSEELRSSVALLDRSDAASSSDELLGRFEDVEISVVVVGNLEEFVRPDTVSRFEDLIISVALLDCPEDAGRFAIVVGNLKEFVRPDTVGRSEDLGSTAVLGRSEGVSGSVVICRDRDVHAAAATVRRRVAAVEGTAKIRISVARYMMVDLRRDTLASFKRKFLLFDEKYLFTCMHL